MDLSDARSSIPIAECMDGWLYWITARNASLGIWRGEHLGFEISRWKFGSNFSFIEDHWDTGRPHGTATPHLAIERAPDDMDEEAFLGYMNGAHERFDIEEIEDLACNLMAYQSGEVPNRASFSYNGVVNEDLVRLFAAVTGEEPGDEWRFADCDFGIEKRGWFLERAVQRYNDGAARGTEVLPRQRLLINDEQFCAAFEEATGVDIRGTEPDL